MVQNHPLLLLAEISLRMAAHETWSNVLACRAAGTGDVDVVLKPQPLPRLHGRDADCNPTVLSGEVLQM